MARTNFRVRQADLIMVANSQRTTQTNDASRTDAETLQLSQGRAEAEIEAVATVPLGTIDKQT